LELLYTRAGGAQAPSLTLNEAADIITNISVAMAQIKSENDRIRHRLQELDNETSGYAVEGHDVGGYL